jgi:putative inorganic carbon (hco3(-)) transporter
VTRLTDLLEAARAELPAPSWAHWGSVLFSLSVFSFLISLAAAQALLALASVLYILQVLRDRTPVSFPPVKLPLALFCLFTLVSLAWAENPTVGWFAVRKLTLFVILLLGVNLVVSAKHLTVLYQGLFVESAVAGLVSVPQFFALYRRARVLHPGQVYLYMTVERVRGFMGHWMNFGGQQMLIFAALLAFLLLAKRTRDSGFGIRGSGDGAGEALPIPSEQAPDRGEDSAPESPESPTPNPESRILWWLLLAIVILSLLLNFSRGVWLGCFVATSYLVGCWRPRCLWVLPLLMIVGLLLSPRLIRQRIHSLRQPALDPSVSIRLEMWQAGLRMIRKHPLVGVGPNNISEVYTLYLAPGKAPEVGYREHLHNDFIQFGAERGLPCLAAWMWFMAALGWHFRTLRRKLKHLGWVADAAAAAWLAMLVEGCFEFNFGTSPVLMLFLFVAATPFCAEKVESRPLNVKG